MTIKAIRISGGKVAYLIRQSITLDNTDDGKSTCLQLVPWKGGILRCKELKGVRPLYL